VQELKDTDLNTYKLSVDFIGECAADTGGPTREMFSLLYKDVITGKLTRGSMPNLTFIHDQSALMANEYKILGQLVALAFLNNASLPHFLSPTVAHYILGTECNESLGSFITELPVDEVTVKEKLNNLLSCETPQLGTKLSISSMNGLTWELIKRKSQLNKESTLFAQPTSI
jgi:hypothetical protein